MKLPNLLKNSLRNTPAETLYKRLKFSSKSFDTESYEVESISFNFTYPAGHPWYDGRIIEPGFTHELARELDEEDVFFDVGSHMGFYTALAREIGAEVHAFEADLYHYLVLEKNADTGTRVSKGFVGDRQENISLDSYDAEPTIVKIDVEGAEYRVLSGMKETLAEIKPEMYVEIHPSLMENFGDKPQEVIDLLEENGYELKLLEHRPDGEGELTDLGEFSHDKPESMIKAVPK